MSYANLEAFKAWLRLDDGDDVDDVELQRCLDVAASQIDHLCSRTFTAAQAPATVKFGLPYWDETAAAWVLAIDDLQTTTDLEVKLWDGEDWTIDVPIADIGFRPLGAPPARAWTKLVLPDTPAYSPQRGGPDSDYVKAIARWGWTTTPEPVVQANLIQGARIRKRQDAQFGIVGSPDGSAQTRLLDRIDSDAQVMLRGYIKYWVAR